MTASDAIKSALTVPQLCQNYGFQVNRGNFINCPFHGEKTGSLHIKEKSWKCFGCHKSGTVIDFAMELFGLSFKAACERLNADFCLGLSMDKPDPGQMRELRAAQERQRLKAEREEQASREREEHWWQVFEIWDWLRTNYKIVPDGLMWLGRLDEWLYENERY